MNKTATNHEEKKMSKFLMPCTNSPVLLLGTLSFIDDSTKQPAPPLFDEDPIRSGNCIPLLLEVCPPEPPRLLSKMSYSRMMNHGVGQLQHNCSCDFSTSKYCVLLTFLSLSPMCQSKIYTSLYIPSLSNK